VKIEIEKYRLQRCDKHNWCVEVKKTVKEGKKAGEVVWTNRKFYPKLEQACLSLFDLLVSETETDKINFLYTSIQKAKEDIVAAVAAR